MDNCCVCICYQKSVWFKRKYYHSRVKERLRFFCPYPPCCVLENIFTEQKENVFSCFFLFFSCFCLILFMLLLYFCELVRHPQHFHLSICDCAPKLSRTHTHWLPSDTTRFFSFRFHWHFPWTPTATEWKIRDYFVPIFSQMRKISLLFFSYSFTSIDGKA